MTLQTKIEYLISTIGKSKYDSSHVNSKLTSAIAEAREITFKYQANSVHSDLQEHLKTFKSYGKQNKAGLIATLEDVQRELNYKHPNKKLALYWLNTILETSYYTDKLQKRLLKDATVKSKKTVQIEVLEVS